MAIPMPGLDRLPTGPVRDFVEALHDLYDAAGQPAARSIMKAASQLPAREFDTVSHETVSATLRASAVPTWEKVRSIVHVLAGRAPEDYDIRDSERRMNELWRRARRAIQADTPGLAADAVLPARPQHRQHPPRPAPPPPEVRPASGTRPVTAPCFVGREALIESMRTALDTGPDVRLVLHGPAGSGKTQTVLQYLERHADGVPVWWVPASDAEPARRSLIALAAEVGLDQHHRGEHTVRRVLDLMQSGRIPHLMVFDDLGAANLPDLVPNGGHVVITTRDPALGHDGASLGLAVGDLSDEEAGQLLRRHEPGLPDETFRAILDTYGRTPLALAQIVAWSRLTASPLTGDGPADPADRLTAAPVDGYPSSASLSLLFTMDRLEAASRQASFLLNTLVLLAPVPVSKELLSHNPAIDTSGDGPQPPGDPVAMNMAIVELCRHGLARLTDDGSRVEVLPPTRLVARRAMSREDGKRSRAYARALLTAADPGWPGLQPPARLYREISRHAQAAGLIESDAVEARLVVYHLIRFHHLVGDNEIACELGETAYQRWQGGNDPAGDDYLVLRTSHEWANALRTLGRYELAGQLTLSAISQLRVDPAYGEDHPYTLAMASSRAADLRIAGKYQRALEIDRETFQRSRLLYDEDDPRTTMSRHNLAINLRLTGDFRDAEAVDRDVLQRQRARFGDDDWRTLLSVNALAEDLNGQGRHRDVIEELEPLLARVELQHREQGRQWTWMERGLVLARRALALAHRGAGRFGEALAQLEAAYTECAALLGERNEHTLALRMSHFNTLHLLGRTDEAAREAERVFADYREMFGQENPLTVAAEMNLANVLRARGDHAAALSIDRFKSEALRETVGLDHPFAVAAAVNLASDYAKDGHPHRIEASRRAVELARRVLHPDHPDVLAAEANQALDLAAAGQSSAKLLRQQALRRLGDLYGPGHPITVTAAHGRRIDCILEPPLP